MSYHEKVFNKNQICPHLYTLGTLILSRAVLKNTKTANHVLAFSIDSDQNVVFIVSWPDTKVYKYESNTNTVNTLLGLSDSYPRGLCHTMNGDLLVSMHFLNKKKSRIVRYSCSRKVQNDKLGGFCFSVDSKK